MVNKDVMDCVFGTYEVDTTGQDGKKVEICSMGGREHAQYIRILTDEGWWCITTDKGTLYVGRIRERGNVKIVDHLDPANGQVPEL